jgi:hypothetical protein
MKSLGRNARLQNKKDEVYGNQPQKIFTGNPNDIEKRRPNFNDKLHLKLIKEYHQGNKVLQLQK